MPITDPCVVRLMVEGGSIEIFGHKESDGSWSFMARCTSLVIEDDGNDDVTVSGMPRFNDLAVGLPPQWIIFIPRLVHPELRDWFRDRYSAAVASLPQHLRESHMESRDRRWRALFASTPPDRWSKEDEF
jgi:hypothetical protein